MTPPIAAVVLGMHRSGTSVLARALMAVGVNLGEDLQSAGPPNPKGYFEDRSIVALNEEILNALGCRWDSLLVPPMPPELQHRFRVRAATAIRDRFGSAPLWGFKDPRVTRLQPFWHDVIADTGCRPVYVLSNRHPLDVAASLAARDGMPRGQALALWAMHQVQGLEALLRHGGMVADYEAMLSAPDAQLRRLATVLSQPFDAGRPGYSAFTEEFLEPGLARSRTAGGAADLERGRLGELCHDIHRHLVMLSTLEPGALTAAAEDGSLLCNRVRSYVASEAEWLETVDEIQTAHVNGALRRRALEADILRLESDLARVTRSLKDNSVPAAAIKFIKKWRRRATRLFVRPESSPARVSLERRNSLLSPGDRRQ